MRGTGSCDNHALENELRDKGEVLSQTAELTKCKMFAESFLESDAVQTKAFLLRILSQHSCALAWCRCVSLASTQSLSGTAVEFHECCLATGATAGALTLLCSFLEVMHGSWEIGISKKDAGGFKCRMQIWKKVLSDCP